MTTQTANIRRFGRIGKITIAAVYFLILIGGIVRASGAGMGCPDWPTCFGRWVPPVSESQLPADYQKIYAELGYRDTRFNATKTWTEYLNRLSGVTIGFLIFLTLVFSWRFRKSDPAVLYISAAVFILVGFQGWLGALVVASNLRPAVITLHMLVALIIVLMLIYVISRSQRPELAGIPRPQLPQYLPAVLICAMGMTLIQVIMGTQVRESVDTIATAYSFTQRELWREHFPLIFYVHRSFSALILFTNGWLIWKLLSATPREPAVSRPAIALGGVIVCGILSGIVMDRLQIPAAAQPVHLLMATLVFGLQSFILITLHYSNPGTPVSHRL